jgi:tRNA A37 threonylcarbamoyladenosine dehydratase
MSPPAAPDADLERRFGGLRRLFGDAGYRRVRAARIAIVGVGGVGSWAAEALARSGVAALTLVDLDHVAESNINRQVQAVGETLGQAKVDALAERIADIHPGCVVHRVEAFADEVNWPGLLPAPVDVVIDACDQTRAKLAIALAALRDGQRLVMAGAAGGKRRPQAVDVADLGHVTHDPLLAAVRQRLRRHGGEWAGRGGAASGPQGRFGITCVFSREPVQRPFVASCESDAASAGSTPAATVAAASEAGASGHVDQPTPFDRSLNCAGYGSSVMVTASFGLASASAALDALLVGVDVPVSATIPA